MKARSTIWKTRWFDAVMLRVKIAFLNGRIISFQGHVKEANGFWRVLRGWKVKLYRLSSNNATERTRNRHAEHIDDCALTHVYIHHICRCIFEPQRWNFVFDLNEIVSSVPKSNHVGMTGSKSLFSVTSILGLRRTSMCIRWWQMNDEQSDPTSKTICSGCSVNSKLVWRNFGVSVVGGYTVLTSVEIISD